mgnify:CR=1 FL=1
MFQGSLKNFAAALYDGEELSEEDAKELEAALKEQYPGADITMAPLSLSIACHIGPGSLAVACSSKLKELE